MYSCVATTKPSGNCKVTGTIFCSQLFFLMSVLSGMFHSTLYASNKHSHKPHFFLSFDKTKNQSTACHNTEKPYNINSSVKLELYI